LSVNDYSISRVRLGQNKRPTHLWVHEVLLIATADNPSKIKVGAKAQLVKGLVEFC
jgi:hypothetical protein